MLHISIVANKIQKPLKFNTKNRNIDKILEIKKIIYLLDHLLLSVY